MMSQNLEWPLMKLRDMKYISYDNRKNIYCLMLCSVVWQITFCTLMVFVVWMVLCNLHTWRKVKVAYTYTILNKRRKISKHG